MAILQRICICMIAMLTLLSCNNNQVYSESVTIEESWTYDRDAAFSFQIEDTTQHYEMILDVEHAADFAYQNAYVLMKTSFPDGTVASDIVSLDIGHPKGGWRGSCSGERCIAHIWLQPNIKFKNIGDYTIQIYQHSREKSLAGIHALTLTLNRRDPS